MAYSELMCKSMSSAAYLCVRGRIGLRKERTDVAAISQRSWDTNTLFFYISLPLDNPEYFLATRIYIHP